MSTTCTWSAGQRALLRFLEREGILATIPDAPVEEPAPSNDALFALIADAVPPTALAELMAVRLRLPLLEIDEVVDPGVAALLPAAVASRCGTAPVGLQGELLEVATANPLDLEALKTVEFASGRRARILVTTHAVVQQMLERLYGAPDAEAPAEPAAPIAAAASAEVPSLEPAPVASPAPAASPEPTAPPAAAVPPAAGSSMAIVRVALESAPEAESRESCVMTNENLQPAAEPDREAIATLAARLDADREAVAARMQRTEMAVEQLAARLESVAAAVQAASPTGDLESLRSELGSLAAAVQGLRADLARLDDAVEARCRTVAASETAALRAVVDETRSELARLAGQAAQQATEQAKAAVAQSTAEVQRVLAAAAAEARAQLASGLEETRRLAIAGGERAAQALALVADLEGRLKDFDALRATLGQVRDEVLRRVTETEAGLGVRIESMIAGVEAETRAVREALWDRLIGLEQRVNDNETSLNALRIDVPQAAAQAFDGVSAVHGRVDQLDARVASLEQARSFEREEAGVVDRVREEALAAVAAAVGIATSLGRCALALAGFRSAS
ncbi:MAG TPA: hypothetical protein VNO26_10485 [Candidatus Limnocylindria bacterium]|nr:hypothetical protein [Candidatus Limnocylindria bacterium]